MSIAYLRLAHVAAIAFAILPALAPARIARAQSEPHLRIEVETPQHAQEVDAALAPRLLLGDEQWDRRVVLGSERVDTSCARAPRSAHRPSPSRYTLALCEEQGGYILTLFVSGEERGVCWARASTPSDIPNALRECYAHYEHPHPPGLPLLNLSEHPTETPRRTRSPRRRGLIIGLTLGSFVLSAAITAVSIQAARN